MNNKIAFICSNLRAGGSQNVVKQTTKKLSSIGYDVTVITLSNNQDDFYILDDKVKRISLDKSTETKNIFSGIKNNLSRIILLRKIIKKEKYKTCFSFITETNIITIISALFIKTKVIISERNDPYKQRQQFRWFLLRSITYPLADVVTANSKNAIKYFDKSLFVKKTVYMPNPLPEPKKMLNNNLNKFLSVGKLTHQKGHDTLIKAFAKFIKKNNLESSFSLTIAGIGKDKSMLRELAVSLGVEKNIFWVSNKNIYELLKSNSIFILASRYEGTSNALIEAISTAKFIIVSEAASKSLKFLKNNHNCIVFPVDDIESLVNSMDKIVSDNDLKIKLSNNLINDYYDYFSIFKSESNWEKLIN